MVIGGASSSSRSAAAAAATLETRFYNPPAVRRLQEQQRQFQLQQQQQQKPSRQKHKQASSSSATRSVSVSTAAVAVAKEAESRTESDASVSSTATTATSSSKQNSVSSTCSSPPPVQTASCNLDRFLESTAPVVPAQYSRKTRLRDWRNSDVAEPCLYFTLDDLWESFKEWSAYGCGVPLVLNGSDCVIQYYVPYLSGIQIYVNPSRPTTRSSDGSSEGEVDRLSRERRGLAGIGVHVSEEGFLSDECEALNSPILPVFEYLEKDPPYRREPLADKIARLASKFPDLKTYNSCDLLPCCWISVAWYPIYRIPTGPTLKDLDACFLTFHTLSTPSKNTSNGYSEALHLSAFRTVNSSRDTPENLRLPSFGLALYKFKGSIWTSNGTHEQQLASSLLEAAEKWLCVLRVEHPDFQFFMSHNSVVWR